MEPKGSEGSSQHQSEQRVGCDGLSHIPLSGVEAGNTDTRQATQDTLQEKQSATVQPKLPAEKPKRTVIFRLRSLPPRPRKVRSYSAEYKKHEQQLNETKPEITKMDLRGDLSNKSCIPEYTRGYSQDRFRSYSTEYKKNEQCLIETKPESGTRRDLRGDLSNKRYIPEYSRGYSQDKCKQESSMSSYRKANMRVTDKEASVKSSNNWRLDRQRGSKDAFTPGIKSNYFRKRYELKPTGLDLLEEISELECFEALTRMSNDKLVLQTLLENEEDPDLHALLLTIVAKICQSSFQHLKVEVLMDICNSRYILKLESYLSNLPFRSEMDKYRNPLYWEKKDAFWENLLTFCETVVVMSPTTALQRCRALACGVAEESLRGLRERHGYSAPPELAARLQALRENFQRCEKKAEAEKKTKADRRIFITEDESRPPPEDFRELPIMPTLDDLLGEMPYVRPNIVEGAYDSVDHYLDVQFRLLREDCYGPLREGIRQYLHNDGSKHKFDNIRVHKKVQILQPYNSKSKVGIIIQFETLPECKKLNWNQKMQFWEQSKRFMFGALLLLTNDKCRSFILAQIVDRDLKYLSKDKLAISLCYGGGDAASVRGLFGKTFLMIESEVYFEPYYHVLKALQDPLFPEHLAMKNYIVDVEPATNAPRYLSELTKYTVNSVDGKRKYTFHPLQEESWPTAEQLGIDATQYAAYRLALTHEFSVIQGPPGTGKTFIGVLVASTLLKSSTMEDIYDSSQSRCTMLVICYTNHALDQFLEAILKVTKSLVRIGGQSRSKLMEPYMIHNVRKNAPKILYKDNYPLQHFHHVNDIMEASMTWLLHLQNLLEVIDSGIVSYNMIRSAIPEVIHLLSEYSLKECYNSLSADPVAMWLFENASELYAENGFTDIGTKEVNDIEEDHKFDGLDENIKELILDDDDISPKSSKFTVRNAVKTSINELFNLLHPECTVEKEMNMHNRIDFLRTNLRCFTEQQKRRKGVYKINITDKARPSDFSLQERWAIYFRWMQVMKDNAMAELTKLQSDLRHNLDMYEEARMGLDKQLLRSKEVVGMTTTGAARLQTLIRELKPQILIVEEAAEVLESHIVVSLTKHCEHVILIGDHQQLRPSAAHYKLTKHYNMEISLFERMITNGHHSRRLGVQHRMRPAITSLIVLSLPTGDHQQLRPSAAHYKLAKHYNMEISLFERMITNGHHSRRLGVQHRMRPAIASLIVLSLPTGDHQQLRPSAAHYKLAKHYNMEISLFERMITNGHHSRRLGVQHRVRPALASLIVLSLPTGDHQQLRPSAAHYKLAKHYNMEISLFERMITNGHHSRRLGVQHRMRPAIASLIVLSLPTGDHQQLRPSAAHYKLAKHYNIEISLFERMITNGHHSRRLGVQHRMRPAIASLIVPAIYPELQNHPSVENFPNVRGLTANLFFLTHNNSEDVISNSSSPSNQLEADLTLGLANYIMQQGYKPAHVTILTAYSGQMLYMKKASHQYNRLKGVKITVLDNYQGEESKIILLSLVRNNSEGNIGFLKTSNRVCVALSRAKEGFYILGNMDMLKKATELWATISRRLDEQQALGTSFTLRCRKHPEQITEVRSVADFEKAPEGGCTLKCDFELSCTHPCPLVCHGYPHREVQCPRKCEVVLCELGHVCPLPCWEACERCFVNVIKTLPCGHEESVACYLDSASRKIKCFKMVGATLPTCGHEVTKECHEKVDRVKCGVPCGFVLPCAHVCANSCHKTNDPDHERYVCEEACNKPNKGCTADAGDGDSEKHACPKLCFQPCDDCSVKVMKRRSGCGHRERAACSLDVDAKPCRQNCKRILTCGHHCMGRCHEPCGNCTQMVKKTLACGHQVKVRCTEDPRTVNCPRKCSTSEEPPAEDCAPMQASATEEPPAEDCAPKQAGATEEPPAEDCAPKQAGATEEPPAEDCAPKQAGATEEPPAEDCAPKQAGATEEPPAEYCAPKQAGATEEPPAEDCAPKHAGATEEPPAEDCAPKQAGATEEPPAEDCAPKQAGATEEPPAEDCAPKQAGATEEPPAEDCAPKQAGATEEPPAEDCAPKQAGATEEPPAEDCAPKQAGATEEPPAEDCAPKQAGATEEPPAEDCAPKQAGATEEPPAEDCAPKQAGATEEPPAEDCAPKQAGATEEPPAEDCAPKQAGATEEPPAEDCAPKQAGATEEPPAEDCAPKQAGATEEPPAEDCAPKQAGATEEPPAEDCAPKQAGATEEPPAEDCAPKQAGATEEPPAEDCAPKQAGATEEPPAEDCAPKQAGATEEPPAEDCAPKQAGATEEPPAEDCAPKQAGATEEPPAEDCAPKQAGATEEPPAEDCAPKQAGATEEPPAEDCAPKQAGATEEPPAEDCAPKQAGATEEPPAEDCAPKQAGATEEPPAEDCAPKQAGATEEPPAEDCAPKQAGATEEPPAEDCAPKQAGATEEPPAEDCAPKQAGATEEPPAEDCAAKQAGATEEPPAEDCAPKQAGATEEPPAEDCAPKQAGATEEPPAEDCAPKQAGATEEPPAEDCAPKQAGATEEPPAEDCAPKQAGATEEPPAEDCAPKQAGATEEPPAEDCAPKQAGATEEPPAEDYAPKQAGATEEPPAEDCAPKQAGATEEPPAEDCAPKQAGATEEPPAEDCAPKQAGATEEPPAEDYAPKQASATGERACVTKYLTK